MNTRNLIDAMADGKSIDMEQAFNSIVAERIASKIDSMKQDIAQTMFKSEPATEEATEE
jgi:hypothetical protein